VAPSNGEDGRDVARIYQRWGARYDRMSALLDRMVVNRMRAELVGRATGDVLEVAIGTGANLRHYPPGVRIIGVDFATRALVRATARARGHGLDCLPVLADAHRLAVGTASVDTVICTLAGCTFTRPDVVFAELRRVLRPGGQALFLEHVRPAGWVGRAAVRAIKPVTRAALGCNPDRDTVHTIEAAGFTTEILDKGGRGLVVSLRATPTG
jgi:ubiquinone/menaquinone biosynthesis C-methylase UbiE